ncbi:hypothetical protein ASE61_19450 [Bosea sp. Root670]|nr:hypothetical protein ASE61_19450 [Bosea sp. Root670]
MASSFLRKASPRFNRLKQLNREILAILLEHELPEVLHINIVAELRHPIEKRLWRDIELGGQLIGGPFCWRAPFPVLRRGRRKTQSEIFCDNDHVVMVDGFRCNLSLATP